MVEKGLMGGEDGFELRDEVRNRMLLEGGGKGVEVFRQHHDKG